MTSRLDHVTKIFSSRKFPSQSTSNKVRGGGEVVVCEEVVGNCEGGL